MKLAMFAVFVTLCSGFMLAPSAFAQQPAQPSGPPLAASPTSSPDQVPGQTMPPDTKAPAEALTTAQVRQQIQEKLKTEPELTSVPIRAKVNNNAVILKGNVGSERQHDLALRIAQSYAGGRQIVDRIKVANPRS